MDQAFEQCQQQAQRAWSVLFALQDGCAFGFKDMLSDIDTPDGTIAIESY